MNGGQLFGDYVNFQQQPSNMMFHPMISHQQMMAQGPNSMMLGFLDLIVQRQLDIMSITKTPPPDILLQNKGVINPLQLAEKEQRKKLLNYLN